MRARIHSLFVIFVTINCFLMQLVGHATTPENGAQKNLVYFLNLSDVHFDPFIQCHNVNACPLIEKLRQAPVSQWPAIFAPYAHEFSTYRQDSSYALLSSALTYAQGVAQKQHAKFVLVLGDFIAHDFQKKYQRFSQDKRLTEYHLFLFKTLAFLTQQFNAAFPNIDVYAAVGNNDSYHGDYVSLPRGTFFKEVAPLWATLIKTKNNRSAMQNEFSLGGYYAVTLPNQPQIRLIVLNTNFFSTHAKGKNINQAADAELNWLNTELKNANVQKQKVLIAMHIPMGIDIYASLRVRLFTLVELWQPKYSQSFRAMLKQFAPEIMAIFASHLHSDWFQILSPDQIHDIPAIGVPAISPVFGNNPGFKMYAYSPDSLQLLNFITYYYPLDKQKTWGLEYNFIRVFQHNCIACPIVEKMDLLQPTGELAEAYKKYYAVSTASQPITTQWNPYYWCAIREVDMKDYKKCIEG